MHPYFQPVECLHIEFGYQYCYDIPKKFSLWDFLIGAEERGRIVTGLECDADDMWVMGRGSYPSLQAFFEGKAQRGFMDHYYIYFEDFSFDLNTNQQKIYILSPRENGERLNSYFGLMEPEAEAALWRAAPKIERFPAPVYKPPEPKDELTKDVTLFRESISLKNGHAGCSTVYRAETRTVEHSSFVVKGRFFPRTRQQNERLPIPWVIRTEAQLRQYVKQHRRQWIR